MPISPARPRPFARGAAFATLATVSSLAALASLPFPASNATLPDALAFGAAPAEAAKLADVTFDDTAEAEGRKLVLNGLGLRKFAIFKVYVGALYVEKKSTSAEELLAAPGPRLLKLRFLRDVGASDMRKALAEGFEKNCAAASCKAHKADVDALGALMSDSKEGQTLEFLLGAEGVTVSVDGARKGEVKKPGLGTEILAVFIGKNPPNESLRDGLLGK